jgi:hypothetical protein
MADWTDGCFNGVRFAEGVAGGNGTRTWIAANNVSAINQPNNKTIIVAISMDTDDMCSLTDDMVLQYQDDTDVSGYSDLSGSGELTWDGPSDLVDGGAVIEAEVTGTNNCSTMGADPVDGLEAEGTNLIAASGIGSKLDFNMHWCVDLSGATAGHDYSFRFRTATGGGGDLIATTTAVVGVVAAGKIDLVSRNKDSTATEGSCTVTAIESDGGSPAKPLVSGGVRAQTVTNGSGVGTIEGLISGDDYFLHYVDSTGAIADGTEAITAVAA